MSEAATELRDALAGLGVSRTYQADGEDLSVLSVWTNLTVWCMRGTFRWRDGHDFGDWATHPTADTAGAAVKIHARYQELRNRPDSFQPVS